MDIWKKALTGAAVVGLLVVGMVPASGGVLSEHAYAAGFAGSIGSKFVAASASDWITAPYRPIWVTR